MISTNSLANAIHEANKGKPAYVGVDKQGRYLSYSHNFVTSRTRAMRLVNPELFESMGLSAVPVDVRAKKGED